jgi:hypothetical protein
VAPAAALAGDVVHRAAIATDGFRFADVRGYRDANFVPGAVKYGDLPVLLALRAPHPLTILGDPELPEIVSSTYAAAGASGVLRRNDSGQLDDDTIAWLTGRCLSIRTKHRR